MDICNPTHIRVLALPLGSCVGICVCAHIYVHISVSLSAYLRISVRTHRCLNRSPDLEFGYCIL